MRFLLLAALAAGHLFHAALPEFLLPDTKVVIRISVRGLMDSPILKDVGEPRGISARYLTGTPLAGIDPGKDIDDLIIASTGEGEKAPALMVLRGRFPAGMIPGGITQKDPKTPNSSYALLDPDTLIGGDVAVVRAVMDGRRKSSALAPVLAERIAALDGRYDLWAVGEVPKGIHSTAASSPEIEAIDRFELGASLQKGLEIAAQIHVRTPKDTEKLMQTLKLLEMLVAMQPKTGASQSKVDLKSTENTISLSLFIPEEELKTSIEAQKEKWMSTAAPAPKPEPTPGRIVKNERGDTVTVTLPRK
jgi:hypothetical protein